MKTNNNILGETRLNNLRAQGYYNMNDLDLSNMAFGIRFAYRLCVLVIVTAIATQSIILFSIMTLIAFLGIVLPKHPFDYVFNYTLSHKMKKPLLPARSKQLKFACMMATTMLASVVYLMAIGNTTAGLLLAGTLAGVAILPSTIDFCVPSFIYNKLYKTNSN